jgi:hypothetical protein
MKASTKPVLILVAGLVIFLASAVFFGLPQVKRAAQIGAAGRARLQLAHWSRAAEAYREAHGVLPSGEGRAVLEALRDDPVSRQALAGNGAPDAWLRDPWGTTWQIRYRDRVEVRSAGPNRQFDDEDDLSSLTLGTNRTGAD